MNRNRRAEIAAETLAVLDAGSYNSPAGETVNIGRELGVSCAGTMLYLPDDYDDLLKKMGGESAGRSMVVNVHNRTTLDAARSLAESYSNVATLNFASAKNPGGGFLSGSQAQEESLARASGLHASLQTQPDFYDYHRNLETCLYSDRVIYSPGVPVFRDDDGNLLEEVWKTNVVTAAAVNAGAVRRNEPAEVEKIIPVMERRTRMVLACAAAHGCEALVLGAWGCGVFQNDPATIARIFAEALNDPLFAGRFAHVEFAVYDPSPEQTAYNAFAGQFEL